MKASQFCIFSAFLFLVGCDKPVTLKPSTTEIVGTWSCSELPDSFVAEIKNSPASLSSSIEIREDGSFTTRNFPLRDPARLWNAAGKWELTDYPTPAPKGQWMLNLGGEWIRIRSKGSDKYLRYWIDPVAHWKADFTKEPNINRASPE